MVRQAEGLMYCERPTCERVWPANPRSLKDAKRHRISEREHVFVTHPSEGSEGHGVVHLAWSERRVIADGLELSDALVSAIELKDRFKKDAKATLQSLSNNG